jgi:hypothetical protein
LLVEIVVKVEEVGEGDEADKVEGIEDVELDGFGGPGFVKFRGAHATSARLIYCTPLLPSRLRHALASTELL